MIGRQVCNESCHLVVGQSADMAWAGIHPRVENLYGPGAFGSESAKQLPVVCDRYSSFSGDQLAQVAFR